MATKKGKPKLAPSDLPRTIAHHGDQGGTDLGHALRHAEQARSTARGTTAANLDHAIHHLKKGIDKHEKRTEAIVQKVPAVGAELKKLEAAKPDQVKAAAARKAPARKAPARKATGGRKR